MAASTNYLSDEFHLDVRTSTIRTQLLLLHIHAGAYIYYMNMYIHQKRLAGCPCGVDAQEWYRAVRAGSRPADSAHAENSHNIRHTGLK